jgi:imidazolonepropionase-like amidohydrolase
VTRATGWLLVALLTAACGATPESRSVPAKSAVTALVGGRVQADPEAAAIRDGVVLIAEGRITAVGRRADVPVPTGAMVIDCAGGTVTAGFWNSHVHFMAAWARGADSAPAAQLGDGVRAMLTSYGVVHAVDTGSLLTNTLALRRRVEQGEIPGPSILTAGTGFVPEGGSPYYILPARLPELRDGAQTAALVNRELDGGADLVKLFTGSWARRDAIVVMPVDLVRAATGAAHRRGKMAIAHPSNSAGARAAIEGGVDILAHTFPSELDRRPWDRALPGMMRERGMALIPTLKLWPYELRKLGLAAPIVDAVLGNGQAQLRAFADLGGQVLFGTDVGYMTDYDPTEEYQRMAEAGLSFHQILDALTVNPVRRFDDAAARGTVEVGKAADLVVLGSDPSQEIESLSDVRYTIRAGRVLYEGPVTPPHEAAH